MSYEKESEADTCRKYILPKIYESGWLDEQIVEQRTFTKGKIVVSGFLEEVMPTFTVDDIKPKVKIDDKEKATGPFYVFSGDLAEHGKGKLYVSKAANPHLGAIYDKYLD